ncbi:katanin p60 ATPase-containing subunit A1-like, partial [Hyalella azteca]|uniref:Katanin p60 ATPase-containing subunit A1-like n=1 Tax=Hyalella azteca TaxID=294128 RepID=A0A8B7PA88_HYAAZ
MMVSLQDIASNTRLAREMALTSQYETAVIYYQGVVQQIHRLLATIQEPSRKQQWQQAQQQIAAEYEQLKELMNTLSMFENPMNAPDSRTIGGGSGMRMTAFEEPTRDPDVWAPPPPRDPDVWPSPTNVDH